MTKQEINYIKSSEVNIDDATPVMKQYLEIKREHQDVILLYRLGDFYETFFEDALTMSKVLEITLTGKDCGQVIGRVPLAGIPAKAIDGYLEKLINVIGTPDIKVITGVRRSGKSKLLEAFKNHIEQSVHNYNIIQINF